MLDELEALEDQQQRSIRFEKRESVDKEVRRLINQQKLDTALSVLESFHKQNGYHAHRETYNMLLIASVKAMNKEVVEKLVGYFRTLSIPYDEVSYLGLLTWYGKTKQLKEVENVWKKVTEKSPQHLSGQIIGAMVAVIRKNKLGRAKLNEVVKTAKHYDIKLPTSAYRELFIAYRQFNDANATLELYSRYTAALKRGEVKEDPYIWQEIINVLVLNRPRT